MTSRIKCALMVIFWSGTASVVAQKRVELLKGDVVPGAEWQEAIPESLGYSSKKLDVLRQWVSTQDTTSMMVVVQGRVVFSYGDVTHPSKIASARKSILGMLYGKYVRNGTIDLDKTVKQLGLDDKEAFLPIEETATLRQLLAARSGVYLPTSSFGQRGPGSNSEAAGQPTPKSLTEVFGWMWLLPLLALNRLTECCVAKMRFMQAAG